MIENLIRSGFTPIVVVDDGSKADCAPIFKTIGEKTQCCLLRHAVNLGKGRAIKTGLNHILAHESVCGVVTCDADGQHVIGDVEKVARTLLENTESLILGVREFDTKVPLRSKVGNLVTRGIFYFLTGKYLSDTQTGLRGIPLLFIPLLIRLDGEGYEYEMNMLIASKSLALPVIEEKIQTIYLENNKSSHFNVLLDSMNIYFLLLRFALSSFAASMLDIVLFSICFNVTSNMLFSLFLGRYTIGPFINFFINRNYVFHHKEHLRKAFIKYYLFATIMALCAYLLMRVVIEQFSVSVITAKIMVETFLFIVSFTVQRDYIFCRSLGPSTDSLGNT